MFVSLIISQCIWMLSKLLACSYALDYVVCVCQVLMQYLQDFKLKVF